MILKKTTSLILTLCMAIAMFALPAVTVSAAPEQAEATAAADYGLVEKAQDGVILHAWNWSYNNIKANMQAIAQAGYSSVQTSPVQRPKDYSASYTDVKGQWWKLYQPTSLSFSDGNTWLGTKAEFKAMCDEAEKYGVKVIVDIVANHMADTGGSGNNAGNRSPQIDANIRNNDSYWHINNIWANDGSRYDMTQGSISQPDLNTGNSEVQQMILSLLNTCIDLGADGFRFDAAKHIELPNDSGCGSQFWPTVINGSKSHAGGKDIFYYGEILNTAATAISNYTQYMSVTDNYTGDEILANVNSGNASGAAASHYSTGAAANKVVLWAESHDTYMGSSGNTAGISNTKIKQAWAMVGSRNGATALFFARPAAKMGDASTDTTWKDKSVTEVNKFHNYFAGQSEYLSSNGSVAYNERGTTGVVISKLDGGGSVSLKANKMASGTYTDQITGNTFTVANGTISGTVGSDGIAVVYNAVTEPQNTISRQGGNFKTETLTLTLGLTNATSGTYQIDNGQIKTYTDTTQITIGAGVPVGTSIRVKLTATDGKTTTDVTYTFTKVLNTTTYVYFDNSQTNWSNVYCYMYNDSGATVVENAAWPGVAMAKNSDGLYEYQVPDELENSNVLFTAGSSGPQIPAQDEPGMVLNGSSMIYQDGQWQAYTDSNPTDPQPTDPEPTDPVGERYMLGDVTFDDNVTLEDVLEIQRYLAYVIDFTDLQLIAADVDRNGQTTIVDIMEIQKYIAKQSSIEDIGKVFNTSSPTDPQPTEPEPTEPEPTAPTAADTVTLYFSNGVNWDKVYMYTWQTDSGSENAQWPGQEMSPVGKNSFGETIYKIELNLNQYDNIIFNNGNGQQTQDIPISSASNNMGYYCDKSVQNDKGHYGYGTYEFDLSYIV